MLIDFLGACTQKRQSLGDVFRWMNDEWNWTKTILNRYVVNGKDFLGMGSFSIVRKGTDLQTGQSVAVKQYHTLDPKNGDKEEIFQKFKKQVELLTYLSTSLVEAEPPVPGCTAPRNANGAPSNGYNSQIMNSASSRKNSLNYVFHPNFV